MIELLRYDDLSKDSKYFSRFMTHKLILFCLKNSINFYDFGGVDKKNMGVFKFKKSFGGELTSSNGINLFL